MADKRKQAPAVADGKQRMEFRFDVALAERIKALADDADVSVNMLVQGVMQWAVEHAQIGRPVVKGKGDVVTRRESGCVWFGEETGPKEIHGDHGEVGDRWADGVVHFWLDFSPRGAVRNGPEFDS